MKAISALAGFFGATGVLMFKQVIFPEKVRLSYLIAPYLGITGLRQKEYSKFLISSRKFLTKGHSAPWASDSRIEKELRKCASGQNLTGFRLEQFIFACIAVIMITSYLFLQLLSGKSINSFFGLTLILMAFVSGGGLRSWLLKESGRKRILVIEAELPSVLDLLAFAVSAGEPTITAMQRVAKTCQGELAEEINRLIVGLSVGDNFLQSLHRVQKELDSPALSRSFRAIIMAIERGTPLADVLKAQAMDSRNLEARKLMTIAAKKETLMMVPVVFLILPMIVVVALYPGLIALNSF